MLQKYLNIRHWKIYMISYKLITIYILWILIMGHYIWHLRNLGLWIFIPLTWHKFLSPIFLVKYSLPHSTQDNKKMVCMKIPMKQKQCWPPTKLNYLFLSSNSYSPIFILEICNNVGFAQHDRSFLNETDWVL